MSATAEAPITLDTLVESIKANCALVARAEASALDAAIAAGHDLARAKGMVPGAWLDWVAVNLDMTYQNAALYMRLARYEKKLRAAHATSIAHARELLKGLPCSNGRPSPRLVEIEPDLIAAVRSGEVAVTEAAKIAGVTDTTIRNHVVRTQPGGIAKLAAQKRLKQSRARAERAALRKQEEERRAAKAGGGISEVYSLVERALQIADKTIGEYDNKEIKAAMAMTYRALRRAHEGVNLASGLAYGQRD